MIPLDPGKMGVAYHIETIAWDSLDVAIVVALSILWSYWPAGAKIQMKKLIIKSRFCQLENAWSDYPSQRQVRANSFRKID